MASGVEGPNALDLLTAAVERLAGHIDTHGLYGWHVDEFERLSAVSRQFTVANARSRRSATGCRSKMQLLGLALEKVNEAPENYFESGYLRETA